MEVVAFNVFPHCYVVLVSPSCEKTQFLQHAHKMADMKLMLLYRERVHSSYIVFPKACLLPLVVPA